MAASLMAFKTKPFNEQIALVTGGGTGIGRAFAEALSSAGAIVIIASRRQEIVDRTASELNSKIGIQRVFPYAFDIRQLDQTESLVRYIVGRWGAIDILINNSGLAVPETVSNLT